ncbi:MAG: HEAT repeat domain-containing protein [Candidatus Hydrogenedentes bacterium]|nr:HEAT repeat domain-containing protein [Candidatus Hydrogenedentota bacterium]
MSISRLILFFFCCLTASAEIQNIHIVQDTDRLARVTQEFTYTKNNITLPAFRLGPCVIETTLAKGKRFHRYNEVVLDNIWIPEPEKVKNQQHVRTFFTFYARTIALSKDAQTRLSLITSINHERTLVIDDPSEVWRLYLIDLKNYLGKGISVAFRGPSLDNSRGSGVRLEVALPRIVIWHGPYYGGGLSKRSPGRHGASRVDAETEAPYPSINPADIAGGPLIIEMFDFVQTSTLQLVSTVQDNRYKFPSGIYYTALRLGSKIDKGYVQRVIDGEIEILGTQIVPDFTLNDDARLLEIEEKLRAIEANVTDGTEAETDRKKIDSVLENTLMYFGDTTVTDLLQRFPGEVVATYLIGIVDDPGEDRWVRQKAIAWLSRTGDPRVEKKLREYIDPFIAVNEATLSQTDYMLLHAAIMSIGHARSQSALDYLCDIARHEFWDQKNITIPEMNWPKEQLERHMRHTALWGVARSGTDRGVQFFNSGSNPMPDILRSEEFAQLLKMSKLYRQGIFTDPENSGNDVSDNVPDVTANVK